MPYKTEKTGVLLPHDKDRRRHLTDEERIAILGLKGKVSQRELGRLYHVHHRTIAFIHNPAMYLKVRKQFMERRKDGRYKPSKAKWAATIREHRAYKYKVLTTK